jgi:RNA polymerase sigma-70 factor (ECF subfamily)
MTSKDSSGEFALPRSPGGSHAPGGDPPAAADSPQLSHGKRVLSDVSSLAMDRGALAAAAVGRPGTEQTARDAVLLEQLSDTDVMLRVKAGDDAAFDYLVTKYRRPIVHFMYRMAHNAAVAEELAQEVFLRVYRARESYAANAKFTTWLYRIASNLAVNHARDTKHERPEAQVSLDEPDSESSMTLDLADGTMSAEEALLRRERLAAIRRHVHALPERQRVAVLMHKYQGMDYRQIAEVLKLSESATKSLLFRAYETLRERLKAFV